MNEVYDIIIVGAGPAGMSTALNTLRAGKKVLMIESDQIGGQMSYSPRVENYPAKNSIAGSDLADEMYEQIEKWGIEFTPEEVTKVTKEGNQFTVITDMDKYKSKSVVVATGARARHLGVPREEELLGHGVSYCAICDGQYYEGKDVALIGDANTGLQYAILLAGYCRHVYVCTLFDRFFAEKIHIKTLQSKNNVSIHHNLLLKEFIGDPELNGLRFENTQTKEKFEIDVSGVFIAVGQIPHNEPFAELVDIAKGGYIQADENCMTKTEGLFVAGDTRTKGIRQISTAISDGSVAAFYACQYLDKLNAE